MKKDITTNSRSSCTSANIAFTNETPESIRRKLEDLEPNSGAWYCHGDGELTFDLNGRDHATRVSEAIDDVDEALAAMPSITAEQLDEFARLTREG